MAKFPLNEENRLLSTISQDGCLIVNFLDKINLCRCISFSNKNMIWSEYGWDARRSADTCKINWERFVSRVYRATVIILIGTISEVTAPSNLCINIVKAATGLSGYVS